MPATLTEPATAATSRSPRSHRVLVVDDNEAIHEDFRKILGRDPDDLDFDAEEAAFFGASESSGSGHAVDFRLDFATQGREALERVTAARREGDPYEIVFMDVRMPPGWDGIETTARLWEVDEDLQVVICTAYSDYSWGEMIDRLGCTNQLLILKKPFDTIEVVQLAHSLTAKWRLHQSWRHQAERLEEAVTTRTRELEAANAKLRLTQFSVDHATDAMFWLGPDGRVTYANAATCRPLGYTADALLGKPVGDIFPDLDAAEWQALWASLPADPRRTFEATQLAWDGRRIPVELTLTYFNPGSGEMVCASARDITRRVEILAELSRARDTALQSAEHKGQFLANMSHEIRTPMNGVIGMSELLLHTNLDREQRDYVDTIRASADVLLGIINDVLDSSKIDSGKMQFERRPFDLREVVEGTLDVVAPAARKKNLELAGCVPPPGCNALRGDAGRLKQVLTNLLGNAVKFTDAGEVTLVVSAVSETAADAVLKFEVRDTGIGIDAASQGKIFEAFHQADGSNTRKYGGTGLGLTICKQIVEAMGGEIGMESTPGTGSLFWITLPFEKATTAVVPAATDMPRGLPVLVVDDNETNRHILQLQLANLLQKPTAVAGATAALDALRAAAAAGAPFPLAIVDMQMPQTDGLSLVRSIKADPALSDTRLILLSSLGEPLGEPEMRQLGISEYIVKPVKQSRLGGSLASLFGTAPALPPAPAPVVATQPARVLLAEDNFVNQKVALLQLKALGYSADVAGDGVEALEAFARTPYDIVLMDCQMPRMDGYAAARRLRELYPRTVRIVAMTAHAMPGDREKCLAAGMDDFLTKPVSPAELRRVLEAWQPAAPVPAAEGAGEPLPPPPVDLERLQEITGHDADMFRQISHDYLEQADEIMALMVLAIERRDAAELRRQAHKLGGSSASCGMSAIVPLLQRLERMGESAQLATARDLQYQAVRQLERIRRFLARHAETLKS